MTKPLPDYKKKKTRTNRGHGGHWYTRIQKKFLKDNQGLPRRALTILFNKRFHCDITSVNIKSYCTRHGLRCDQSGQYPKGHVPWTKGTRGLVKPNSGQFKKGIVPANTKPLGYTRFDADGYLVTRIPQLTPEAKLKAAGKKINNYRAAHILKWEKKYGPLPFGHIIRFKDGDKTNRKYSNLELVSRALNVRYNQNRVNDAPTELRQTIKAYSQLQHQVGILKKKRQGAA